MILLNPKQYAPRDLDERSADLMRKTIGYFEAEVLPLRGAYKMND